MIMRYNQYWIKIFSPSAVLLIMLKHVKSLYLELYLQNLSLKGGLNDFIVSPMTK